MRFFTLFELLLVMALVALIGGSLTFFLPKLSEGEKFEQSVDCLINKLSIAQEIAINYESDVIVKMERDEKGVSCRIIPLKPLPSKLIKGINKDPILPKIKGISSPELTFEASGNMPKGTLLVTGLREVKIALKGFPSKISRGTYEEKKIQSPPYPQEILSPS